MNTVATAIALTVLGTLYLGAQKVHEEPRVDAVQDAIEAFTNRDKKPNEVVVVLEPPASDKPVNVTPPAEPAPVKVTGNVPPEAQVIQATAPPADAEVELPKSPPKPEQEVTVRVEKVLTGKGKIDPSKVTLRTPYPAKPLSSTPDGWRLDTSDSAPPFTREVEIAPGSKITLTITPHLMIPDADGAKVFTISEPGYDHSVGYQQTGTVGAILSNSVRQLDEDSKKLSSAIDHLEQLLVSLPKPDPQPTEIAAPAPAPAPTPAPTRRK
jgi:hypothetical protein